MAGITNDYFLQTTNPNFQVTDKKDNGALGKDAFLQILITQLQNQDPTSPMDDKEFIAQMAQFSSLEQMQNMTTAIEELLMSQQQTQMMNYTNFIGKEVKWHELTDKVDDKGKPIYNEGTGVIKELKFVDGGAVFILNDGKQITAANISSMLSGGTTQTVPTNPIVQASELLGKSVQYKSPTTDELITAIIESIVHKKNGDMEYVLSDGSRLAKDQFTVVDNTSRENDDDQTTETEK